jgi:hypothetical protein
MDALNEGMLDKTYKLEGVTILYRRTLCAAVVVIFRNSRLFV